MDFLTNLTSFFNDERLLGFARALILFVIGIFLARFIARFFERMLASRLDRHQLIMSSRVAYYGILILFTISALHELGFKLQVLLGAAGILTVAMGFASQTSASNLISGLFLIIERSFSIGDVIKIGNTTGEIVAIDLLSTKLRTFDNLYVRLPNETMIKSEVTTLTKFPIRRLELEIKVALKEDLNKLSRILFELAEKNPLCLDEPKPALVNLGFAGSSINLQFSLWAKSDKLLQLRNSILIQIKEAFEAHGIEIR